MLHFVYSYVFEVMAYQGLGGLGTIVWNGVLAQELFYLVLCYFVTGETTDSPQISVDTKLVENTALYPKGGSSGK